MPAPHAKETEALWKDFRGRMLAYIQRRLDSIDDAEDILQEVFLRIHTHAERLPEVENVAGWIYRIAANAIVDHYRKKAKDTGTIERFVETASAEHNSPATPLDEEASSSPGAELAQCMEPLVNRLPEHYRDALTMTDLGGMTQKDAAQKLGLSVSGMKARVQRGRSRIKDLLDDCCAVELDRRRGVVGYEERNGGSCGCDCGDDPSAPSSC